MKTEIVYSKTFNQHDNPGHPENAKRTDVMIETLRNSDLFNQVDIIEPQMILPEKDLFSIHNKDMISQVKAMSKLAEGWIDLDTYVCQNDFETARMAAGGLVHLSQKVMDEKIDNGFALVRPPGHHATKTRSMGFYLFNNISIAAMSLANQGKRVLIFDPDVHHGNGTQDIFYDTDRVLFQSFHLSPHFPGTGPVEEIGEKDGKGFTMNAPLPRETGEKTVQSILDDIFKPIAQQFKPDIILISSGFDSHYSDRLGGLYLGIDFFGDIIRQYQRIQPRIVLTIEGGYNLEIIGNCFLSQVAALVGKDCYYDDVVPPSIESPQVIETLKSFMQPYWDL